MDTQERAITKVVWLSQKGSCSRHDNDDMFCSCFSLAVILCLDCLVFGIFNLSNCPTHADLVG